MLTEILRELINNALADTGQLYQRRLPKGLRITIRITATEMIYLGLDRDDVHPSQQEYDTVLKNWPEELQHLKPFLTPESHNTTSYWLVGKKAIIGLEQITQPKLME